MTRDWLWEPTAKGAAILPAALLFALAACDERRSPTAPDTRSSAIAIENATATATKGVAVQGPFTYQVSVTLHETAGVRATISQVTATLAEISSTTTNQLSSVEAFGTTQIPANGTLVSSGITVAGSLPTASHITVRVAFVDEHGNSGSAQMSTAVKAELTGDWIGPSTFTQPPGDWSLIRVSLTQRDDVLTGEVITRDGRRFPLSGCVSCEWAPRVSVGGLPTGSSGCAIGLIFPEFEFRSGQMRRMSGRLTGRCPGTAAGTADLQRST